MLSTDRFNGIDRPAPADHGHARAAVRSGRISPLDRRVGMAHVDDLLARVVPNLESRSLAFQDSQRRDGIREWELREALRSGRVETDWAGRTIVHDRVLGLRIDLDASGRFGLDVTRIGHES